MTKSEARIKIAELVEKYKRLTPDEIKKYSEEDTKNSFIVPLFRALGWDFGNREEVSAEEHVKSSGFIDFGFYLNGRAKFYLEAKKLSSDVHRVEYADQAIRYAFNRVVTWAVLTDFESIKVFNAQAISKYLGDKLVFEIPLDRFNERFDQLWLLSKESFENDLIDNWAEEVGKKLQKVSVTDTLFEDLNKSREILNKSLSQWNPDVSQEDLDEGIQKLLDRLVFLRVAEDRKIEEPILRRMIRNWEERKDRNINIYETMVGEFRELDDVYNSNLFAEHPFERWEEYDNETEKVIEILYGQPGYYDYDFKYIPADTLGAVYENYLGYQLAQSKKGTPVSKSSSKRKEQGIYYTPSHIVEYIVKNALKPILDRCKTWQDLNDIKVLDPACGSGSFLTQVLEMIYQKHKEFQNPGAEFLIKTSILRNNLYGVDLDEKAIEIARLNLLINSLDSRLKLPPLDRNIKIGNSLISGSDKELEKYFGKDFRDKSRFNYIEEFPEVFERKNPGFDVVIGNPPWISYYSRQSQKLDELDRNYYLNNYRTFSKGNARINTIMLFVEKSVDVLRSQGLLGFVLDKEFQDVDAYIETRKLLLNETSLKSVVLSVPFPNINLDTTVLITEKQSINQSNSVRIISTLSEVGELGPVQDVSQKQLAESKEAFFRVRVENPLLKKILKKSRKLGEISRVTTGMCITMEDFSSDMQKGQDWHKGLFGSNVSSYKIEWPSKDQLSSKGGRGLYLCYSKELEKQINERFAKQGSKTVKAIGDESRFRQPKIFVRQGPGEVRLIAALDNSETYYAHQTLHVINQKNKNYGLRFILGYINSSLATYLAKEEGIIIYGEKKRPQIRTRALAKLPVPVSIDPIIYKDVEDGVGTVRDLMRQQSKESESSSKWKILESEIKRTSNQIDQLVYKLYNLAPEEIEIIEKSTKDE